MAADLHDPQARRYLSTIKRTRFTVGIAIPRSGDRPGYTPERGIMAAGRRAIA